MNEIKLKKAFARIKQDMDFLKVELGKMKAAHTLNDDIKEQVKKLEEINLEKFVIEMESEFKAINTLLKNFNVKFQDSHKVMLEFSKKMGTYEDEIKEVKKKLSSTQNRTENTHLDVEMLEEKFAELQELMNEKVSLEVSSLKLEKDKDILDLDSKIENILKNNIVDGSALEELNEILNEKVSLETSSLRLEFTEEIAKIYDLLGEKAPVKKNKEIKTKIDKPKKKVDEEKKTLDNNDETKSVKKDGKLKKVAKWLFVDDEEEFDSIKDEVKKGNKK